MTAAAGLDRAPWNLSNRSPGLHVHPPSLGRLRRSTNRTPCAREPTRPSGHRPTPAAPPPRAAAPHTVQTSGRRRRAPTRPCCGVRGPSHHDAGHEPQTRLATTGHRPRAPISPCARRRPPAAAPAPASRSRGCHPNDEAGGCGVQAVASRAAGAARGAGGGAASQRKGVMGDLRRSRTLAAPRPHARAAVRSVATSGKPMRRFGGGRCGVRLGGGRSGGERGHGGRHHEHAHTKTNQQATTRPGGAGCAAEKEQSRATEALNH